MKISKMEFKVLLVFSLLVIYLSGTQSVTFTFSNNCPFTVWPGTQNGAGHPQLSSTGFELPSGMSGDIDVPMGWAGRFWGRTQCTTDSSGKFSCATGNCASGSLACGEAGAVPPATYVELTLNSDGGRDLYDINLIEGFNLPVALTPIGGCPFTTCPGNVNAACPNELAVKGPDGAVIACKSACLAFNAPEYCCTGAFGTPDKCPPTAYSKIFKGVCPQAYSYSYDDRSSTLNCPSGANYRLTFCP